jgi:hypothetical protein
MARHLEWQEQTQASGQTAYPIVPAPVATPLMMQTISQTVMSLSEILAPARQRPNELAEVIGKLFAAFNQFTGDAAKTAAQVDVWAEELSEFPLYAIRKAYKWAVRGEGKLPSLSAFIADAKLAVGTNVLERNRLLVGWLARHRKDSIGGNAR